MASGSVATLAKAGDLASSRSTYRSAAAVGISHATGRPEGQTLLCDFCAARFTGLDGRSTRHRAVAELVEVFAAMAGALLGVDGFELGDRGRLGIGRPSDRGRATPSCIGRWRRGILTRPLPASLRRGHRKVGLRRLHSFIDGLRAGRSPSRRGSARCGLGDSGAVAPQPPASEKSKHERPEHHSQDPPRTIPHAGPFVSASDPNVSRPCRWCLTAHPHGQTRRSPASDALS